MENVAKFSWVETGGIRRNELKSPALQNPALILILLAVALTAVTSADAPIRINCGGPTLALYGELWEGDAAVAPLYVGGRATPLGLYNGTEDILTTARLWPTGFNQSHGYVIPVPTGLYWVRLYFSNLGYANQTGGTFSIALNRHTVLLQFNSNDSAFQEFSVPVDAAAVSITFLSYLGLPHVSGIEIVAASSAAQYRSIGTGTTILHTLWRFRCGGPGFFDLEGRYWGADSPLLYTNENSTTVNATAPVAVSSQLSEAIPRSVFLAARTIPAKLNGSNGLVLFLRLQLNTYHLVRLYFAELGNVTAGQRLLDVYLNGLLVRSALDIAASVGRNTGLYLDFNTLPYPNSDSLFISVTVIPNTLSPLQEPILSAFEVYRYRVLLIHSNSSESIGINCGGEAYTDTAGQEWLKDTYFTSGRANSVDSSLLKTYIAADNPTDFPLYFTYREWVVGYLHSYNIPVNSDAGLYWVHVNFLDSGNISARTLGMSVNNVVLLGGYNVREALSVEEFEFLVPVSTPNLTVTFSYDWGAPYVNTIRVIPASAAQYQAAPGPGYILDRRLRQNAGGLTIVDNQGRRWNRDSSYSYIDFATGNYTQLVAVTAPTRLNITGTEASPDFLPSDIYRSQVVVDATTANPSAYLISSFVPSWQYILVRLHFAELIFKNVGDRIMDIYILGQLRYEGLDVLAEAGPNAALYKDFVAEATNQAEERTFLIAANSNSKYSQTMYSAVEVYDMYDSAPYSAPTDGAIRINCGSNTSASTAFNQTFSEDSNYVGGFAYDNGDAAAALGIANANSDMDVMRTERVWSQGEIGMYKFSLQPGLYWVRLYLNELQYANTSERRMSVYINGFGVRYGYSPPSPANTFYLETSYLLQSTSLTIKLVPATGQAHLNALEIIPQPDGQYREIFPSPSYPLTLIARFNGGGNTVRDEQGRMWRLDSSLTYVPLANTSLQALRVGAQISNVSTKPDLLPEGIFQDVRVASDTSNASLPSRIQFKPVLGNSLGVYLFRLHFAAILGDKVGDRLLDVYVNDVAHIEGLDVAAEVGENVALYKDLVVRTNDVDTVMNVTLRANSKSIIPHPFFSAYEVYSVDSLPLVEPPPEGTIRINCGGGEYTDMYGRLWAADQYYVGGTPVVPDVATLGNMGAAYLDDVELFGAYRKWNETTGSYVIPVLRGFYHLLMVFMDVDSTSAQLADPMYRVFAVSINGRAVLVEYTVRNQFVRFEFNFYMHALDENITIEFTPLHGSPFVNIIELTPTPSQYRSSLNNPGLLLCLQRFNVGGYKLLDALGRSWTGDNSTFAAGLNSSIVTAAAPIKGTNSAPDYLEAQLYQTARTMGVPVNGSASPIVGSMATFRGNTFLLLRFHFAELEYSNVGDRLLDVYVDDKIVVSGLDVVKEAGSHTAFYKDLVVQADLERNNLTYAIYGNELSRHPEPLLSALEVFIFYENSTYPPAPDGTVRINCGSAAEYADPTGKVWMADAYFEGGEAVTASELAYNVLVNRGYYQPRLFATYRRWTSGTNNSYVVPVSGTPGLFWVRLYFALSQFTPTASGTFAVYLDGFQVIDNLALTETGAGYYYEFSLPILNPTISITFSRLSGDPYVSGIEIMPQVTGSPYQQTVNSKDILRRSYRFNLGGQTAVDSEGRTWDVDYSTNYTNPDTTIANVMTNVTLPTALSRVPPSVYQTQRRILEDYYTVDGLAGSFYASYGTQFLVVLHFAEFDYSNVGDRVMDIKVNDKLVYSGLDIVKEVGVGVALYKNFTVTKDSGAALIKVAVLPSSSSRVREPKLNGLEILTILPGPSAQTTGSSSLAAGVIAGLAVGGALLALVLLGIALLLFFRQKHLSRELDFEQIAKGPGGAELLARLQQHSVRPIPLAVIREATGNFSPAMCLGMGGFGDVYRGEMQGRMVAIKRAKHASPASVREFVQEVELISQLNHVNLVRLIGFCTEKGEQIFVMEYMAGGTLAHALHEESECVLGLDQRLEIALGAARGLNYLHTFAKEPIIHRDIKSENILLDKNFQAKVADFGLLKPLQTDGNREETQKVVGTRGYLDPEYYTSFNVTTKSDVYSFGVVLLEVLTGRMAILEDKDNGEGVTSLVSWVKKHVNENDWEEIPDPTMRHEKNKDEFMEVVKAVTNLALSCVQQFGADRPPINQVQLRLEEICSGEIEADGDDTHLHKGHSAPPSGQLSGSNGSGSGIRGYSSIIFGSGADNSTMTTSVTDMSGVVPR